jgi:hypothetical protein
LPDFNELGIIINNLKSSESPYNSPLKKKKSFYLSCTPRKPIVVEKRVVFKGATQVSFA